ncbi:YfcZ/YiiS family protein [Endozoicomonas euniceicola]|uniref:YfcZ/YiiS family protein n=1 Tax=Endozoicomonas euniceicola TaxID=1234143 RepID=A0ABY6GY85_9GAMM|nr:YfcZ/YiiS family protein [Endozoicomonas euniceicola]UYM17751.1 YfcZ/YiiS family protein [Endozoicomonas euniceicola]
MTGLTDPKDTHLDMDIHAADLPDARERLYQLTALVHKIETAPCLIDYETELFEKDTIIHAHFEFCCAAEKLIFQLNTEFNSKYKLLAENA